MREIVLGGYAWAERYSVIFFGLAVVVPIVGTWAAIIGKGGRTDRDGRVYANVLILVAVAQFVLTMVVGFVGIVFLDRSIWDTDILLIVGHGYGCSSRSADSGRSFHCRSWPRGGRWSRSFSSSRYAPHWSGSSPCSGVGAYGSSVASPSS